MLAFGSSLSNDTLLSTDEALLMSGIASEPET